MDENAYKAPATDAVFRPDERRYRCKVSATGYIFAGMLLGLTTGVVVGLAGGVSIYTLDEMLLVALFYGTSGGAMGAVAGATLAWLYSD